MTIELQTERLMIVIPRPEMASAMCAYATRNRQHHAPFGPERTDEYYSLGYWEREMIEREARALAGTSYEFILLPRHGLRGSNVVVGDASLTNLIRGYFQAAYLGYNLDVDAVGKGLMFEALSALIPYAFDDLKLHRIMANYVPDNTRTAALLKRLGFVVEGTARDYLFIGGAWRDHVLTSITSGRKML